NLHSYFDNLGIRMPPGRAEGSEDRYVYLDSNGNPQEVQVCFQWNNPEEAAGSGNVMVIAGLTPDLARALDQMIDGKPDAQEGFFRRQGVDNGTAGGPGVVWAETNQDRFGDTAGSARNLDEDQIITVVANYKMNQ
ncbi:MAG: prepilin-type cleavage/methylation domain-containing protein, partial [Proteobacteria bacterium]|nr:prepilin-type cleavage/methylation domain-containing protein [Pseudomonadota bacterium]